MTLSPIEIMELILKRIAKRKTYTIGRLYIRRQVVDEYLPGTADDYFCDTLEPTWRDYAKPMIISATRWNPLGATMPMVHIR